MRRVRVLSGAIVAWVVVGGAGGVGAAFADVKSSECLECHAQPDEGVPKVVPAALAGSVHDGLECVDCHADVKELPHEDHLAPVNCGSCHGDVAAVYVQHGRAMVGADPDIPKCQSCHGTHDIRAATDVQSRVNPRNLPDTCGKCHRDTNLAKAHDIQLKHPVEVYETSVHGTATRGGVDLAATCSDCHSNGGTAHQILGPGDPRSSINHFNIPKTCGRCHQAIQQEYYEGIHGQLTLRGETDTPVCTTCHGEHGILPPSDPRARVSPTQVAEATCAPCHESALLNEKYGLPAGRLASFVDSYHGLKSRAGDTRVANCASCHGGHRILPSSDPRSSINVANLPHTCGGCHPGIDAALATTKIHATSPGARTHWARLVTRIYLVLIVAIIGGMLSYVLLDFTRQARRVREGSQVARMNPNAVAQHTLLAISFILLVITGFALRYSERWPFHWIFGWDGGSRVRGIAHRAAAVAFVISCAWHVLYLRSQEGRRFVRDMLPRKADFIQLGAMLRYNFGRSEERPRFARFSYVEKAEYFALLWGAVVMFVTGACLWFDNALVRLVPKGFLEVMLVIHFYEAVLAALAIAVWHLYSTVFNPAVYPGNPAWITGTMPTPMHEHEHGASAESMGEQHPAAEAAAPRPRDAGLPEGGAPARPPDGLPPRPLDEPG